MKKNKQTAVEWLFTQLDLINLLPREKWIEARKEILEKAKEMEKEQIVNSHLFGLIYSLEMEATKQAEQYYNENYGE